MTKAAFVVALALVATTLCATAPAQGTAEPAADPSPAADAELLSRLRAETGASNEIAPAPWADYFSLVARRTLGWLGERFEGLVPAGSLGFALVFWALLALIAAALAVALFRATSLLLRGRRPRAPASVTDGAPVPAPVLRRTDSLAQIEARLIAGDVDGAAAALWWWLATSLAGKTADPTWTSRELLRSTNRPDLFPHAAELDRMLYGPARPAADDVPRLTSRLAPLLA